MKPLRFKKIVLDNKKVFLLVAVALFISYLDCVFVLRQHFRAVSEVRAKIIKTKKDIETLQKDIASALSLKRKYSEPLTKAKKMISSEQIPLLLKEISDVANKNQVRIMQIRPTKESVDKKSAKPQNMAVELITLDILCGYHHLGLFLNDLEHGETFLLAEEIKITPRPADYFRQDVRLVLKTYVKE